MAEGDKKSFLYEAIESLSTASEQLTTAANRVTGTTDAAKMKKARILSLREEVRDVRRRTREEADRGPAA